MNGTEPAATGGLAWLLEGFTWRDGLDIAVVALIVTWLLRIMRETRAFQLLRGLALLLLAAYLARRVALPTTVWLLDGLLLLWAVALIVVLQPELRRLIASLGEQRFLGGFFPATAAVYHEIAQSATLMARNGWGGLIVIERETSLAGFGESGTRLDAEVKAELLASLFTPGSPLHDGAAIVRGGRVWAAGCMLPLSEAKSQTQALGMRHRAALGITEETDALVVVISEEQKKVALGLKGQLTPPLDRETLEELLALHTRGGPAA